MTAFLIQVGLFVVAPLLVMWRPRLGFGLAALLFGIVGAHDVWHGSLYRGVPPLVYSVFLTGAALFLLGPPTARAGRTSP